MIANIPLGCAARLCCLLFSQIPAVGLVWRLFFHPVSLAAKQRLAARLKLNPHFNSALFPKMWRVIRDPQSDPGQNPTMIQIIPAPLEIHTSMPERGEFRI